MLLQDRVLPHTAPGSTAKGILFISSRDKAILAQQVLRIFPSTYTRIEKKNILEVPGLQKTLQPTWRLLQQK